MLLVNFHVSEVQQILFPDSIQIALSNSYVTADVKQNKKKIKKHGKFLAKVKNTLEKHGKKFRKQKVKLSVWEACEKEQNYKLSINNGKINEKSCM